MDLENLIGPNESFAITSIEYDLASKEYWPHISQLLGIVEAIVRGEWNIGVGSKDARYWRRPDDHNFLANEFFQKEFDKYLAQKSPFPGMDPYLEAFWGEVRNALVVYASGQLNQTLPEGLVARIDELGSIARRSGVSTGPDRLATEKCIVLLDVKSANRIVTIIDFLPRGGGVRPVEAGASIVQVDLHIGGFEIVVRRAWKPDVVEVQSLHLRASLPSIPVPLRQTDEDANLRLQVLIDRCYHMGRYFRRIDYQKDSDPPLEGHDAEWADALLRAAGKRK